MVYYRFIIAAFLTAMGILATPSASVAGDWGGSFYQDTYERGELRLIIGADYGARFFVLQNFGDEEKTVTVYFGTDFEKGAKDKSISQAFILEPYSATDKILLRDMSARPKFVSAWDDTDVQAESPRRVKSIAAQDESASDRDAQPLFRMPPSYPERCARNFGPRESVHVRFDVSKTGVVENIVVLSTTNECFNDETLKAVNGWIYWPKMVDRSPQPRIGVEAELTYELVQ